MSAKKSTPIIKKQEPVIKVKIIKQPAPIFTKKDSNLDDNHLLSDNPIETATGPSRICEDCGKCHRSKLLKCATCYYKHRVLTDESETARCTQCHTVMTAEIRVSNHKSCKKCLDARAKQRAAKRDVQKKTPECRAICLNGKKCTVKVLATNDFCTIHLKNNGQASGALKKVDEALASFDHYLEQFQKAEVLEYYYKDNDNPLKILKQSLINDIKKLRGYESERIEQIRKFYEIQHFKPSQPVSFYHDKIFNPFNQENLDPQELINNLKLELEIIPRFDDIKYKDHTKIKLLNNIWDYFRIHSSSIATPRNKGRHIRALLKDQVSQKYLGILLLGSDFLFLQPLDKAIGWTLNEKIYNHKGDYLVNIICCVGLRPASYNLNIGKLLAMASFSEELQNEHYRRYGHYYACVDTLSIYGKSIQYDRLKCLKFIKDGYTKGYGSDIPEEIYQQGMKYLKLIGCDLSKYNKSSSGKLRKIQLLFNELGMDLSLAFNHYQRGIYYGYTAPDSQDFLRGDFNDNPNYKFKPIMKSFSNICQEWKEQYATQRLIHLIKTNRLMTELDLYQGLDRRLQVRMAVRLYRSRMEQEFGKTVFKQMEYERNRLSYWKAKYNEIHMFNQNKYQDIPELSASYLGGLFDGDGSFIITQISGGFQMSIQLSQSVPEILEILQMRFGGNIYKGKLKPNQRYPYTWRIMGSVCYPILKLLLDGCIIKYKQTRICHDFYQLINENNQIDIKLKLWMLNAFYNQISVSDAIKKSIIQTKAHNSELDIEYANKLLIEEAALPSRMNYNYITGLFDAEGCVTVNNPNKTTSAGMRLKLSQASHPFILYQIQTYLGGCGTISKCQTYWSIFDSKLIKDKVLDHLITNSIIKKVQLLALKQYYKSYDHSLSIEERKAIQLECWQILNSEKHDVISVSDHTLTEANTFLKYEKKEEQIKIALLTQLVKEDTREPIKRKSTQTKPRTKEHNLKISIAQQKRRGFTDEEKKLMRELYEKKTAFSTISEITGRDRNAISKFLKAIPENHAIKQPLAETKETVLAETATVELVPKSKTIPLKIKIV